MDFKNPFFFYADNDSVYWRPGLKMGLNNDIGLK